MKLFRDLTGDDDSTADGHDEAADERECHLPVRHVVDFLEEEKARCGEHLHARQVISGNQQTWKKRRPPMTEKILRVEYSMGSARVVW